MTIVSPYVAFPDLVRGRQMHGIGGADEKIARSGDDQRTGPPQQRLADGDEVPQPVLYVLGKARSKIASVAGRRRAFAQAAMKHRVEFGESS